MPRSPDAPSEESWSISLAACPTPALAELLDPSVPLVWVVGHTPCRWVEWWEVEMPVRRGRPPRPLTVRSLWCELLLSTEEFREIAEQFNGVTLYHMTKRVPDTLITERLTEDRLEPVLRSNGLVARLYQPHSGEVAVYRTWDRAWYDQLMTRESVTSRLWTWR